MKLTFSLQIIAGNKILTIPLSNNTNPFFLFFHFYRETSHAEEMNFSNFTGSLYVYIIYISIYIYSYINIYMWKSVLSIG